MARTSGAKQSVSAMDDARMGSPPRRTRHSILTVAGAAAALRVRPARARTTADCSIGFVHGLLQFDLGCPLLDPHGGCSFGPNVPTGTAVVP